VIANSRTQQIKDHAKSLKISKQRSLQICSMPHQQDMFDPAVAAEPEEIACDRFVERIEEMRRKGWQAREVKIVGSADYEVDLVRGWWLR
jgi:hypothetical protein